MRIRGRYSLLNVDIVDEQLSRAVYDKIAGCAFLTAVPSLSHLPSLDSEISLEYKITVRKWVKKVVIAALHNHCLHISALFQVANYGRRPLTRSRLVLWLSAGIFLLTKA